MNLGGFSVRGARSILREIVIFCIGNRYCFPRGSFRPLAQRSGSCIGFLGLAGRPIQSSLSTPLRKAGACDAREIQYNLGCGDCLRTPSALSRGYGRESHCPHPPHRGGSVRARSYQTYGKRTLFTAAPIFLQVHSCRTLGKTRGDTSAHGEKTAGELTHCARSSQTQYATVILSTPARKKFPRRANMRMNSQTTLKTNTNLEISCKSHGWIGRE